MRRKYSRLLTFIIAFSMILSMHVSFAVEYGGNENLPDPPYKELAKFDFPDNASSISGTSGGVTITGSAISIDYSSVEPVFGIIVKGSTDNAIYEFDTGRFNGTVDNSELLNPGGNIPDISNVKFYTRDDGQEEDDKSTVKVIKKIEIKNDDEQVLMAMSPTDLQGFSFELWKDGSKVYGPVETDELGVAIFEDVDPGTYDVKEFLTSGQQKIYDPEDDVTVTVGESETGTVEVTFTNTKKNTGSNDDTNLSLMVHKRIQWDDKITNANIGDGEFKVRLTGLGDLDYEKEMTIKLPGNNVKFEDLSPGWYQIVEFEAYHPELNFDPPIYQFVESGNHNYEVLDHNQFYIGENGTDNVWLLNRVSNLEMTARIEIEKIVENEDEEVIVDDTTFYFMIQIEEEGAWVDYLEDPIAVEGGESEFSGFLPLGDYRVIEVDLDEDEYEVDLPDGDEVTLDEDGETVTVTFTNTLLDEEEVDEARIEITKIVENEDEEVIVDDTTFYFMIQIEEEGAWVDYLEDPIAVEGGESEFSGFLPLGDYRVIEVDLDEDEYEVDLPDGDEVTLDEDGETVDVTFTNTLLDIDEEEEEEEEEEEDDDEDDDRPPRRNDDDDDDDDDDDRPPRRDNEPDVVITEVLPETTVVPEPEPEPEVVVEEEPEIEEVEEVTPLATLPKTGASDPTVFAGFGAAFMALGAFLKRKKF